jgi:hypothetical protein
MYHDYYLVFGSRGVATPSMYLPEDLPYEPQYDVIDVIKTLPDGHEIYKYSPLGISFYGPDLIYVYLDKL